MIQSAVLWSKKTSRMLKSLQGQTIATVLCRSNITLSCITYFDCTYSFQVSIYVCSLNFMVLSQIVLDKIFEAMSKGRNCKERDVTIHKYSFLASIYVCSLNFMALSQIVLENIRSDVKRA